MSMFFKRIMYWATSITSFRTGDVIPVDGPSGTAKMTKDSLLQATAQKALAGNVAPTFNPDKVGGYVKYELVVFDGTTYMFKNPHSGEWNDSDVVEIPCSFFLNRVLGSNGIETYSGTIEGGANYELIKSVYKSGDVIKVSVQSSQRVNFVGVNLNNESVIIREYASNNVSSSFQYVLQQDFKSFGLYVYGSSSSEVSLKLDTTLGVRIDAVNAAMQQCLTRNNIEPYSIAVTTGSYISASDGVAGYSANGRCSDYVRVQPGDKIKVKCYLNNSGAKVACYDTDKKYIAESSLITDGSYNGYFVIPSGVAYIRCSAYVSSSASEPIFDNLPTTNLVDNIGNYYLKTSDYIATQFVLINGAYLDASTGGLSSSSGGRYTEYAEVSEGDRFYIKCYLTTGGAKVACYDENKQYLQNESLITDGSYNGYFVIPSGVAYIRCSAYVSSSASEPIFESVPKKSFSPKNDNLKLLVFGDSISEDFYYTISQEGYTTAVTPSTRKAWSYRSNLVLRFAELRNYAKSGASYKNQSFGEWNRLSISEQVLIAINDKTDPGNVWGDDNFVPDIIVFAAGTNDGAPNDTPESALAKIVYDEYGNVDTAATLTALNRAKFCEAVMWSMLKIRIEYPYALGLCVLPIQRCSSDVNFGNLNTYLATMARRYGFIPIDGISECGIIKDNNRRGAQGATLDDGLHPNIQGNRMMARMMIQAIDRYYYPTSKL